MFDRSEKETLISSLRDRLLVTLDQAEKDRITRMIMKLKRHTSTGFLTRGELAVNGNYKCRKSVNKNARF